MKGEIAKEQKTFEQALQKYPHLRKYVDKVTKEFGKEPEYYLDFDFFKYYRAQFMEQVEKEGVNLIYPVTEPLFINILKRKGGDVFYNVIEPEMDDESTALYEKVMDRMIDKAQEVPVPDRTTEIKPILEKMIDEIVQVTKVKRRWQMGAKIPVTEEQYTIIRYHVLRERVGFSKLEPLFYDPYLEDIHCTGVGNLTAVHKIFHMVRMSLTFSTDLELNKYILEASERVERPVSDARPVVDAVMPDGSRVNYIYGREISREGSSFTVRKFADTPVSVTDIVNFQTLTSEVAAYLWLCIENGMNIFVCGETASGKTTTLNAISAFIKPDAKIYTVENTAEVTMPHEIWQHLVTREANKDTDVTLFTLLIAALRSRPNYIIVGEIRGEEGNVAFQAMQTGHPVMSTFHSGSVHSMIQRLTGHPIDVPIAFIDNLNVVLIQQAVTVKNRLVRRVTSVSEIERYYSEENKVITRKVFLWDPNKDEHRFTGYYNSFILEKKIAAMLGLTDPKDIYKELELRKKILETMVEEKILNYYKVFDVIKKFSIGGLENLPFAVE
ncbi:type II/IV secretion system ATPase subunit [Candidatus Woesearchaeota archaeon]|nr:type II/IV secretion system ATPase subunit [Candidatus Woesearchaeota archaeon]